MGSCGMRTRLLWGVERGTRPYAASRHGDARDLLLRSSLCEEAVGTPPTAPPPTTTAVFSAADGDVCAIGLWCFFIGTPSTARLPTTTAVFSAADGDVCAIGLWCFFIGMPSTARLPTTTAVFSAADGDVCAIGLWCFFIGTPSTARLPTTTAVFSAADGGSLYVLSHWGCAISRHTRWGSGHKGNGSCKSNTDPHKDREYPRSDWIRGLAAIVSWGNV